MMSENVQGARSKNRLAIKKRIAALVAEAKPRGVVAPKTEETEPCFYKKSGECEGVGTHQCPRCKEWYCDECHEMFFPVDNKNFAGTNLVCVQCYYTVYKAPKFGG